MEICINLCVIVSDKPFIIGKFVHTKSVEYFLEGEPYIQIDTAGFRKIEKIDRRKV